MSRYRCLVSRALKDFTHIPFGKTNGCIKHTPFQGAGGLGLYPSPALFLFLPLLELVPMALRTRPKGQRFLFDDGPNQIREFHYMRWFENSHMITGHLLPCQIGGAALPSAHNLFSPLPIALLIQN